MKKITAMPISIIFILSSFGGGFSFADSPVTSSLAGLNVFTGTEETQTFEDVSVFVESENILSSLDVENENNKVLEITERGSASLKDALFGIEPERPIKLSFKYYSTSGADIRIWLNEATTKNVYRYFSPVSETWTDYETTVTGNVAYKSDDGRTFWSGGDNAYVNDLIIGQWGGQEGDSFYIDDLSFVPYYKLSYDANGGTGEIAASYFLAESFDNLPLGTEFTREGYYLDGWSLVPGGEEVKSVSAKAGEDITLYAIWKEIPKEEFIYDFNSDIAGIADGIIRTFTDEKYTSVELALADDTDVLADYTLFASFKFNEQGIGTYVVDGSRVFPSEATRLQVKFKGKGLQPKTQWFEIPESHRLPMDKPEYTFWVVSDLHLCSRVDDIDWFYMGQNATDSRIQALGNGNDITGDVFERGDFVIMNGDLVNYGSHEDYWTVFEKYLDERLNIHGIPVYLTNGNHEFYDSETNSAQNYLAESFEKVFGKQLTYLKDEHGIKIITDGTGGNYYATDINGSKFIFLSVPEMDETKTTSNYYLSDNQMTFIKEQLAEGAKTGKTTYLVSHVGLRGYPGGSIENLELTELLKQHPNTIVCSAHSHSDLTRDRHYTVVGDMKTQFTHMNDGAISYLETGTSGDYTTTYMVGQYVEVYKDKILMKARRFDETSQYVGHALYYINVPSNSTGVPVLSIVLVIAAVVIVAGAATYLIIKKTKKN